jgi:hypothetical protein
MRPTENTYPEYFNNYIPLVKENSVLEAFHSNLSETVLFFKNIPQELENFAYDEGKWSIKEVLNHCIDTERIFAYRALRFARKDPMQPLSFDQDVYVANSNLSERSLSDLIDEFETVRAASLSLFRSFSPEMLLKMGHTAAGDTSVLALGFTICGHNSHHIQIVRERYLKN